MEWFVILQWTVGILFFTNKVLLLAGMKAGWKVGLIGSGLAISYFLVLELYILTLLEVALGMLFLYGLLASLSSKKTTKARKIALYTSFFTGSFVLWYTYAGQMTILESIASFCMLIGFYYIAGNSEKKIRYIKISEAQFGWIVQTVSHITTAYLMRTYLTAQEFFADMQIASVVICITIIAQGHQNYRGSFFYFQ